MSKNVKNVNSCPKNKKYCGEKKICHKKVFKNRAEIDIFDIF